MSADSGSSSEANEWCQDKLGSGATVSSLSCDNYASSWIASDTSGSYPYPSWDSVEQACSSSASEFSYYAPFCCTGGPSACDDSDDPGSYACFGDCAKNNDNFCELTEFGTSCSEDCSAIDKKYLCDECGYTSGQTMQLKPLCSEYYPGVGPGSCFDEDSTVKMLNEVTRKVSTVHLRDLKVGQKVLAVDHRTRKETFSTVAALPHSLSQNDFIEVTASQKTARGEHETLSLLATEHHTFPLCDTGFRKEVAAMHLKPGHCLLTENGGKSAVTSVKRVPAKEGGSTYTVVLEGQDDLLVVGGLVTHAKPSYAAKKNIAPADAKKLNKKSKAMLKNIHFGEVSTHNTFKKITAKKTAKSNSE